MQPSLQRPPGRLDLLFDADDTLWENNVYFESAIAAFISFLDHQKHSPEQVREYLNACEHETIAQHGYGVKSFQRSLIRCFEVLAEVEMTAEVHARIVTFTELISNAEIELLPEVEETLARLSQRHRLLLVTKGDPEEQLGKFERSGLRPFFAGAEVVPEKNADQYRRVVQQHGCDPRRTWMIGNSPRSDVNPALAAGLNAVFLPHDFTWALEHEIVAVPDDPARYLELKRFAELLNHF